MGYDDPLGGCFHLRNIYRSSRWRSLYGYAENEHLYDTIDQPGQRDSEYPVRAEDHEASSWLADEKGPDAKALEAGRGQFWGEAEAPDGEKLEMTMSTPNVYALTATVGIRIAQYCLDYTGPGGYYTPSMLLGSRFIESIPGIEVHVLNQRLRKI